MKKIFTGTVVSYSQQINVVDEIKRDLPATLSLAIGAGVIWLGFGILFGVISAVKAGKFTDTSLTVLCADRRLDAGLPARRAGALVIRVQAARSSRRGGTWR